MRFFRVLLVLLLCAALPMTGLAASGLAGPCPMQMEGTDGHDDAQMAMRDCEMMDGSPDSHKAKSPLCKTSVQCQLGCLYYPAASSHFVGPIELPGLVTFVDVHRPTGRDPGGLWRPPRTL